MFFERKKNVTILKLIAISFVVVITLVLMAVPAQAEMPCMRSDEFPTHRNCRELRMEWKGDVLLARRPAFELPDKGEELSLFSHRKGGRITRLFLLHIGEGEYILVRSRGRHWLARGDEVTCFSHRVARIRWSLIRSGMKMKEEWIRACTEKFE